MALELTGLVIAKLKPEDGVSKAGKAWNKQDFVIETEEQFPKKVCFTLFGDKTDLISRIGEGERVKVKFSAESREFNGKWFHNLNSFAVDVILDDNRGESNIDALKKKDDSEEDTGLPF